MQSAINDAGVVAGFARHSRNETIGGQLIVAQRETRFKSILHREKKICCTFLLTTYGRRRKNASLHIYVDEALCCRLGWMQSDDASTIPPSPSLCYCCQLLTAAGIFRSVRGMLQLHHSSGEARAAIHFPFKLRRSNPTTKRGIVVRSQSEKYSFLPPLSVGRPSPHRSRLKKDMPTTYPRPQRHCRRVKRRKE